MPSLHFRCSGKRSRLDTNNIHHNLVNRGCVDVHQKQKRRPLRANTLLKKKKNKSRDHGHVDLGGTPLDFRIWKKRLVEEDH